MLRFVPALVLLAVPAQAQDPGSLYTGGGTSYLPYGPGLGGFVPYNPGQGGLGVQPGMGLPRSRRDDRTLMPRGMGTALGSPRTQLAPLTPIGTSNAMMGRGMIRRAPSAGMGGMARPPVGFYPFRQPPSLVTPSRGAMAM
jgi:hypothetical protein